MLYNFFKKATSLSLLAMTMLSGMSFTRQSSTIANAQTTSRPDLVITGLKVKQSPVKVGDSVQFELTVKNQGTVSTANTWIGHSILVNGTKVSWAGETVSIPAGGIRTLTSSGSWWKATSSTFTLSAQADDANQIAESNESNNTYSTNVGGSTPPPPTGTITPYGGKTGYVLDFQDEFNGTTLDTSKWESQWPWGRTNGTHYLTWYPDDAVQVGSGNLRFKGEKRSMMGYNYTTGIVTTWNKRTWTYGYFEMRAKLPKGKGMWPAFWLIPTDSWPPEIDVFEVLGHEPATIYMTNHWTDATGKPTGYSYVHKGVDTSDGYHVYAVEWTSTYIAWLLDGKEVYRTTSNVPQTRMYVLAQLGIGGDWPGNPDATTVFPAQMDVDYIRVFKQQ